MAKVKAQPLEDQLCFAIYKATNQYTKLYRKALEPFDLTYPQYIVLLALWESDHMIIKQLSEKLSLGIGTLNPIISKLVEKDYVTKTPSPMDKRSVVISLTPKGKNSEKTISEMISTKATECDSFTVFDHQFKLKLQELNTLLSHLNDLEEKK
ncbi:MarR family transcriptional regulator [Cytobacillus sp. Sa5YUA1]|uniref:HTH-type transcriptional regulator MgrA n=1 Tax=Cytobacillus stercorigallinarum TaxID=2762240 RepID=A0ABR8QPA0_9BACI|nr:MarR family transcriptional regulator [Cytobacillus stercorigallinarum]MBD7937257.1 MarR family transcriptional regulator [Cytobacillus stercorigallinarum]